MLSIKCNCISKYRLLEIDFAKLPFKYIFLRNKLKTTKVTISFFVTINHRNYFHIYVV